MIKTSSRQSLPITNTTHIDKSATEKARTRYERIARFYDLMNGPQDKRARPWRTKLWSLVQGPRVLEVGVGTGKNLEFWPRDLTITALDFAPAMLVQAHRRAQKLGYEADLRLGDIQSLDFPDATFDSVVATLVFCSVPDPVLGLRELGRVVKPDGQILLLEHMRSPNPVLGAVMDLLNPMAVRMMGANINRKTLENVRAAGLKIDQVEDLAYGGIFKFIVAKPAGGQSARSQER